jgi:uncharacterized membrane protein
MTTISYIFSWLCSQDPSRSFAVAGHVLPLCHRCTGVYLGIGVTGLFLLVSGCYRRGFPPRSILYANIAGLLTMPVFGFHLLDPGPLWRLWSGLVFGGGIAFLAVPAAFILFREGRVFARHTKRSEIACWLFLLMLNTAPLWLRIQSSREYYSVVIVSLFGVFCVLLCIAAIAAFSVGKIAIWIASREVRPWVRTSIKWSAVARRP